MNSITLDFNLQSIRLTMLSIFRYLNSLEELPESIYCIFPSLNSNYFYDPKERSFFEYTFTELQKDKNYFAPYDYTKFLGLDWIYVYNLTDISLLEAFCDVASIKLKWTTKDNIKEPIKSIVLNSFKGYIDNEVI